MSRAEKLKNQKQMNACRTKSGERFFHLPSCCNKYNDGHNNCTTYRCTGRYCNFIHVRCGRWQCAHLTALCVRYTFWRHIELFQRNYTHHNALLWWNIFNFEFTFAGFERRALFKAFVGEQTINDTKTEYIRCIRIPLYDDGIVLAESVFHLHLFVLVGATGTAARWKTKHQRRSLFGRRILLSPVGVGVAVAVFKCWL